MQREGRIADGAGVNFLPWDPQKTLKSLTQNEIRLSRGFLCADPAKWFESLPEHWAPLLHALGAEVRIVSLRKTLDFPQDLAFLNVIEVDGEHAILGFDEETHDAVGRAVVPAGVDGATEVVVEYLQRRLLATLARSWAGEDGLSCNFLASEVVEEVEVVGSVGVRFDIAGRPATLWFGVGPKVLDKLDAFWRGRVRKAAGEGNQRLSDNVGVFSAEIAQLAVPPAMLIDYIRTGTIIDLEIPVSSKVTISLDGDLWGEGELKQFNGMFAVETRSVITRRPQQQDSTPRVRVEIARTDVEENAIAEYAQPGAILVLGRAVNANAALVISGEQVATALVGSIDGRFALSVLPR